MNQYPPFHTGDLVTSTWHPDDESIVRKITDVIKNTGHESGYVICADAGKICDKCGRPPGKEIIGVDSYFFKKATPQPVPEVSETQSPTVAEIILQYLTTHNYDGLYLPESEIGGPCGCDCIDDGEFPCGQPSQHCRPGKKQKSPDGTIIIT